MHAGGSGKVVCEEFSGRFCIIGLVTEAEFYFLRKMRAFSKLHGLDSGNWLHLPNDSWVELRPETSQEEGLALARKAYPEAFDGGDPGR